MSEKMENEIDIEVLMDRIREEVARRKVQTIVGVRPRNYKEALTDISATDVTKTLPPFPHISISVQRSATGANAFELKPKYMLSDFMSFEDEDFVRNAYRGILRREPDAVGFDHYLNKLRKGEFSKIEILGRFRYTREGRVLAVPISGLLTHFALQRAYRIPIIGYGLALARSIVRLPAVLKRLDRFEACSQFAQRENAQNLDQIAMKANQALSEIQENLATREAQLAMHVVTLVQHKAETTSLETLEARFQESLANGSTAAQMKALAEQTGERLFSISKALETKAESTGLTALSNHLIGLMQHKAEADQLSALSARFQESLAVGATSGQLEALAEQTGERLFSISKALETKADMASCTQEIKEVRQQIFDLKRNILDQYRRLGFLQEEAYKRLSTNMSQHQLESLLEEEDHLLDALYASFEDRFRGTREEIKRRAEMYLPFMDKAKAGSNEAAILDIGCGRGEWLELLKENRLLAIGVDSNRVMVHQCQERGLNVVESDAIIYLRTLKTSSIGAVTGMHIIEHIPFKRLVAFFDEVLRVLKPGGMAIFETPNPENLIVGACNFYFDPTHLVPLPPESTQFVLEARGFRGIEILRLHPMADTVKLVEGAPQVQHLINNLFFGAQDYSLVAYKPELKRS